MRLAVLALAACSSSSPSSPDAPTADAPVIPSGTAKLTWSLEDGRVFLVDLAAPSTIIDVSGRLPANTTAERWLVPSPGGDAYALSAETTVGEGEILHAADATLATFTPVLPDGAAVYLEGFAAITDDGATIVYAASGGPHDLDLYVTTKTGTTWGAPTLLTRSSTYAFNNQPSFTRDGTAVLFNCGAARDPEAATNDGCKVALTGGAVSVVIAHTTLPNGRNSYVNFPRDAGSGRIVFEGSWPLDANMPPETIWQRTGTDAPTVAVPRTFDNSVSPCVLGDGRLALLWLGRPGGTGAHELTVVATDGTPTTITPETDVFDIGIGCTSR